MGVLFLGNFLLLTLLGGIGANRVRVFHPSGAVSGSDVAMERAATSDSLRPTAIPPVPAKPLKRRRNVPLAVLILVYALLLASGIGLTVLLLLLGCQLSYTGYGLGAVLITALGLGVVGVLSFFWGRVMTRNLIRMKFPAERSRAARRYQRA